MLLNTYAPESMLTRPTELINRYWKVREYLVIVVNFWRLEMQTKRTIHQIEILYDRNC